MARPRGRKPKWIFKHKLSPYWQYEFRVLGQRIRGSTETADQAEARKIVDRIRAETIAGIRPRKADSVTIGEAFARFQTEVGDRLAERDEIMRRLKRLHDALGKGRKLAEIKMADLMQYRLDRFAKASRPLSPRTVNLEVTTFRRVWRYFANTLDVTLGKEPRWSGILLHESAGRVRSLSAAEQERLISALPPDLAALALFALLSGARLANCIGLQWPDVDFDGRLITLRNVKSAQAGKAHVVPLSSALEALLRACEGQHETHVFTCQRTRTAERVPFTKDGWRKAWAAALAAANVQDFRFHDLRHSAATRIAAATGDLRLVRDLLGHSSIAMSQRYAHVIPGQLREGMELASNPRNNHRKAKRAGRPSDPFPQHQQGLDDDDKNEE